jgi:hypothetical protein
LRCGLRLDVDCFQVKGAVKSTPKKQAAAKKPPLKNPNRMICR